ncbi:leucine-rich repeat, cysteine-containing subtype protein [Tanacetum coccineum]
MIGEATRLGYLTLGSYLISDLGLEYLADGDLKYCLRTLYLNRCDRITDNGIVHLQKLVSLRTLSLFRCGVNITDYGVVALCELPYIENFYLDYLVNLTDISLREIGSKCSEMKRLHLEGCDRITNVGLRALFGLQKLSVLSLISCYKLSREDVKPIRMSCPNLEIYWG